jgi:membrane associated rhomboid family serine protease
MHKSQKGADHEGLGLMIRQWAIIPMICAIMIAVHLVDLVLGGSLKNLGIHPREIGTAYTIATAPWLHEDFAHLGHNLTAFVVLGSLCVLNGVRYFIKASVLIILISGALVWLFGRDATHIGASGWIFGLWSLVITLAWYDRSPRNIAISLLVLFFYGGMAFGVLPLQAHISFESHLFGAVAGVVTAWMLSKQRGRMAPSVRRA